MIKVSVKKSPVSRGVTNAHNLIQKKGVTAETVTPLEIDVIRITSS